MLKSSARPVIRLRGVRQNNLKNFDLDLPLNQLIVISGLSGSGKSSLAFDTLFAEGQRRYIETFSPYARQFFDRMDKPQVDSIEGIPPAIAIEQRNAVKTTRSTVGTMTEICEYMKMLWPHIAQLHCRQCGEPVHKESPQQIWNIISRQHTSPRQSAAATEAEGKRRSTEILITFDLPLTKRLSLEESLALVAKQGYQRLLREGEIIRLDEAVSRFTHLSSKNHVETDQAPADAKPREGGAPIVSLTVIQDRLRPTEASRARFIEACEQAYHFGKGKLAIHELSEGASNSKVETRNSKIFSNRLHCAACDIEYREPSSALFSFNHPVGACPACRGFGRIISIDYNLALPDRSKTLAGGVIKPWQSGQGAECQSDLLRMCRHFGIPTNVPFEELPKNFQDLVLEGEPDYGKDEEHEWPRAWYGVKGYFRWLESKAYKMHVRVLLSRYRAYTTCPDCGGKRFQPEALLYRVPVAAADMRSHAGCCRSLTLADFYELPVRDAFHFVEELAGMHRSKSNDPLGLALNEVRSRLGYLNEVGLGYLTLSRPTRSLSGGETERVNLTTCLGTCLVNTLFVLDEPSVGLHPRDTGRLVGILQKLRGAGNTVIVVEHEASVIRAADQVIDLGPGHGAEGGQVIFQGSYPELLKSKLSLTGRYLSGKEQIEIPQRRGVKADRAFRAARYSGGRDAGSTTWMLNEKAVGEALDQDSGTGGKNYEDRRNACPTLTLSHASRHNLRDLKVEIPLRRFVCITGVSGSGKTTLVRDVLLPELTARFKSQQPDEKASDRLLNDSNGEQQESPLDSRPSTLIEGWEPLDRVVLVDQSILGKTPRSNPAVYIGAFDHIREVFAQSEPARQRGLAASAFSFNSTQGQCERCHGAGFEKIEMQFLSDVFIRCPDCNGRRYRPHILEVKIRPQPEIRNQESEVRDRRAAITHHASRIRDHASLSIADVLECTVDEAIEWLAAFVDSRAAQRASESLSILQEVGLGYLKLGQPINTLSGGESQRLKLVRHLAELPVSEKVGEWEGEKENRESRRIGGGVSQSGSRDSGSRQFIRPHLIRSGTCKSILFLFDEPTTGLHFDDVRVLLKVFQRLVEAGHSVLVVEHNLDVIKSADWVIDLGPDAGDQGGQVVATGTPEEIASCPESHTGGALRELLSSGNARLVCQRAKLNCK